MRSLFFGISVYLNLLITGLGHSGPVPFKACKKVIHNRGAPPDWFLAELMSFGRGAPDSLFEKNGAYDIYSSVVGELGPFNRGIKHRRAVGMDALLVLAAWESSFSHREGIDVANSSSATSKCREEAGIFQTSANSMDLGGDLKELFLKSCSGYNEANSCRRFILCSKDGPKGNVANHPFSFSYTFLLLRKTVRHHGPVLRKAINPWLSRACVAEIEANL